MIILVLLPGLLFIGTAVVMTSLKTFAATIGALLMVLGGVTLGAVWLILAALDFLAEVALAAVVTVPEATGQVANSIREGVRTAGAGMSRVGEGMTKRRRAFLTKFRDNLNGLVRPVPPKGPALPPQADGVDPVDSPSHNPAAPVEVKPQAEEPEQRPNPDGRDAHV